MNTAKPKSGIIKKAIKWIVDEKEIQPDLTTNKLIESAIFRFDLSPGDAEFLYRFFKNTRNETKPG